MMTDAQARDLDETRRLLYMALLAPRTDRYNLAGTLVNALVHHQGIDASAEQVAEYVIGAIEDDLTESGDWLRGQIDRITAELA